MSVDIKEMREERAKIVQDAREVLDGINKDTTEEQAAEAESRFDEMMAKADKLKERIDREERAVQAEKELAARFEKKAEETGVSKNEVEDRAALEERVFGLYLKHGRDAIGELSDEERQLFAKSRNDAASEMRAQSTTNSEGGFTIPEGFYNLLTQAELAYGGMREVATVISTDSGNDLPMPTSNDTSNKGAILAENTQIGEQDITFGSDTLGAYKYTSKLVRVSWELLNDSAFDMNAYLANALGTRVARINNEHFTTGTGSSQPTGILAASGGTAKGRDTATAGAVSYDDLVELQHSVDPAYRRNGSWMFADSTLKLLKKLKDADNRPLWSAGVSVGEPDTILGQRYVINQDFPSIDVTSGSPNTAAKCMTYGDHSAYHIRDVRGGVLVRLSERYADFGQVGFFVWVRRDGLYLNAGTDPVKHMLDAGA